MTVPLPPGVEMFLPGIKQHEWATMQAMCDYLQDSGHPLGLAMTRVSGNSVTKQNAEDDLWDKLIDLLEKEGVLV